MSYLRNYLNDENKPKTQTEREDPRQVQNNAGGFTFEVDDTTRLERFLVLGTDGGTYYVDEKDLTKQNVEWLINLIKRGENIAPMVATVSRAGRALRNDAAIFAIELIFKYGNDKQKMEARNWYNDIVRTSYHLFQSCEYAELLGGAWSKSRQKAVQAWYTDKTADQVAFQAVKYRQRNGWTHRDVFRLAHPTGVDSRVAKFILGKGGETAFGSGDVITGFESMKDASSVKNVLELLDAFPKLPWEAILTQFHKEPEVWKKLFYNGQLNGQALVRNILRLTRIGAFKDMVFAADYAARLTDEEMIQRTRLHPFNYLNALVVHERGQVFRGRGDSRNVRNDNGVQRSKDWISVPVIQDALNSGFYSAFKYVEPAGKRTMTGIDVSGSMRWSAPNGIDITCAEGAAAMAMAIARTEPYYQIFGFADRFRDLGISTGMQLNEVLRRTRAQSFGSTDCALPMVYALENGIDVDTFVVITDNETWAGRVHPHIALRNYRQKMGIGAKLVVVAMTATNFTIADPTDAGMLDVVGLDSGVPKMITEFAKNGF